MFVEAAGVLVQTKITMDMIALQDEIDAMERKTS